MKSMKTKKTQPRQREIVKGRMGTRIMVSRSGAANESIRKRIEMLSDQTGEFPTSELPGYKWPGFFLEAHVTSGLSFPSLLQAPVL
jgi:hypothetical protein